MTDIATAIQIAYWLAGIASFLFACVIGGGVTGVIALYRALGDLKQSITEMAGKLQTHEATVTGRINMLDDRASRNAADIASLRSSLQTHETRLDALGHTPTRKRGT